MVGSVACASSAATAPSHYVDGVAMAHQNVRRTPHSTRGHPTIRGMRPHS